MYLLLQPCVNQFSEIHVGESSRTDPLQSFETASFILMHSEIAEIKKNSLKQEIQYLIWFLICLVLYARIPEKDIINGRVVLNQTLLRLHGEMERHLRESCQNHYSNSSLHHSLCIFSACDIFYTVLVIFIFKTGNFSSNSRSICHRELCPLQSVVWGDVGLFIIILTPPFFLNCCSLNEFHLCDENSIDSSCV